uniref:Uncharacterized protein n=1 Tax=viral metagenome TaxID=1070528 RepID=A0A6C0EKP7_9ZZZZ
MSGLDNPQYEKSVVTTSVIGWIVLFASAIGCLTWYTSKGTGQISNNQQSEDKITAIDEAMKSSLGPNWPYVVLVLVIFIAVMLGALYYAGQKGQINITLSDTAASRLNWIFLVFTIIFGIFMIILAIRQWTNYKREQDNGDTPNYQPNISQKKKDNQILAIIGLGLLALVIGGLGIWYVFFRSK